DDYCTRFRVSPIIRHDSDRKTNDSTNELNSTIHEYSSSECGDIKRCRLTREYGFTDEASYSRSRELCRVRQILENNVQGKMIVKNYEKTKQLTKKSVKMIVDMITSDLLKDDKRLTNTEVENYAKCIVEIFPTESEKTYYIPPIPKAASRTNKSIPASGKLMDKYRNKRRENRVLVDMINNSEKEVSQVESDGEDDEKEVMKSVEWLKNNRDPWKDVLYHWKITFQFRRKSIEKRDDGKVNSLFEQWPNFKQPNGYLLIESDFYALKLTEVIISKEIWYKFFDNVSKECDYHNRDANAVSLFNLLALDDLSDDCRIVIQAWLLAHYIPPKGRIHVQKKHIKFSIPDCKDSMIMHVTRCDDIATTQEKINKRSAELKTSLQPYIIVVGETFTTICDFYVCVDTVRYKVDSALSALDILFKIFHVLDARYPPASEHLWILIGRVVYKLGEECNKSISYVEAVIQKIIKHPVESDTDNNVEEISTDTNTDTEM
ncbi:hypothetical protein PV325_005055, partial [Microctonus aethiopoides]